MFHLISTEKKTPTKPAGLCQGNHFLLPKNDRLLCLRETSLREKRLGGELRAHTCAIVDEKCFQIYSDRFPLCWFESILMLARNDMINEGSRTNPVTGAGKILIYVKDMPPLQSTQVRYQVLDVRTF